MKYVIIAILISIVSMAFIGALADSTEQTVLDNNQRIEVMLRTCFPDGHFDNTLDACVSFRKYLEGELNENH